MNVYVLGLYSLDDRVVVGEPRHCADLTKFHSCRKWMQNDGIFVKRGFIIHLVSRVMDDWKKDVDFIAFREYLRTHVDARMNYNHYKKSLVFGGGYHLTIREYTAQKDVFVNNLVDKAVEWYRQAIHCIYIGAFNKLENRWSCCDAFCGDNSCSDQSGCYYNGLKKDSYHSGRFYSLEYNFIRGWYTCCSQGWYSDGCVKMIWLENGDALLRNCEAWDVNNVCCWVKSLSPIKKDYSESFQKHDITGRILLTVVDDETLQALGVSSVLERKLFLRALDGLKIKSGTSSASSSAMQVSSSKNELKKVFYSNFQGAFTPLLPINEMSESSSYENVSTWQLADQSHRDIVCRVYNWLGPLPSGRKVDKIEHVFNGGRYRIFLGQLESIENRQIQPAFQPTLIDENNYEERYRVLERLDALCHQVSHNRKARIVRMWHGCRRDSLPNLLSDGFATLGTLDDGWYGKAIYFTSSAKYATRYCGDIGGCLIMCYVLLLNPFPIVSTDAPLAVSPDRFRFYGRGNYKNYQCHYIPVSPVVSGHNILDYRPPPNGIDDAVHDELAMFQESNILPQIVIHLK